METTVTPLEGNKVKLSIALTEAEFEPAINDAFRKLAREVRIPGFRPGKAPRKLLEARFGSEVGREQALKDGLPEFYADAVVAESLDVIAPPEIEITGGEESGPVSFDAVVETRPVVQLSGYEGLRVTIDHAPPSEEDVDRQLDGLRDRFADLTDSDDPLIDGNYASIDVEVTRDGEVVDSRTDYLYEVGSGGFGPKLDDELRGSGPGAVLEFTDSVEDTELAFRVLVREARRKVLPELTDEWVGENTGSDTVTELRDETRRRMDLMGKLQAQMALRDRVLDELAGLVAVEAPAPLVNQEMESRLRDLSHRLEHQGVNVAQWLALTGQDQTEFLDELRAGAVRAVLADLALRAVVVQEAIEAGEDDVTAEIGRLAERSGENPQKVRRDLDRRGLMEAVRSDIARGKALQFVVDAAVAVDGDGNEIDVTIPPPEADAAAGDARTDAKTDTKTDTQTDTTETSTPPPEEEQSA
jgi:trigger factor